MKNELKATTFKPNRKRNVSVAKRLGNAVSFRVSAEGLVAGVSTCKSRKIRYGPA